MMNGVLFGSKHSYSDWGLILKSRPTISPPAAKTVLIDMPGSDGTLDLSEVLTNDVKYNNRDISCEFNVIEGRERWPKIYSAIQDYLHGQRLKIIFDDDECFYYIGRVSVNEWKSDKKTSTIVINAKVDPYKYERYLDDWLWDPFDFEIGIIREYKDLRVNGSRTLEIPCRRKHITPSFVVAIDTGETMEVIHKGENYELTNGTNTVLDIVLQDDDELTFTGYGTVTVNYRGGRL